MNIFTISEFTKALGVSKSTVSSWINRDGKIVVDENRNIDINNPINKLQLSALKVKGKELDFNLIYNPNKPKKEIIKAEKVKEVITQYQDENLLTDSEIADIDEMTAEQLMLEKLRLEVVRLKNADILDTLKIQKIEGALIPFDAVLHLFTNALASYHTSYKRGVDSLINVYKSRFGISHDDVVSLKQELHKTLSTVQDSAKSDLQDGAKRVAEDYTEVRGRGERA